MLHATPQFTPQQLLDSGRRAEGEGKLDLAGQFYRHLTDNYAYTAEAAEARNGLGRIGAGNPHQQVWHMNGAASPASATRTAGARAQRSRAVAHRDRYRTGRLLAVLFSTIGWLTIAGALLVLIAGAGAHFLHAPPLQEFKLSIGILMQMPGAMLGGALVVLCGQAVRALFDQANAAQELVALERARAGGTDP